MKSPNLGLDSVLFRTPLAITLGSVTFMVGFLRLVQMSSQVTLRVIRGESPQEALSKLESERRARTLNSGHHNN